MKKKSILNDVWKPPIDFKFPIMDLKGRNLRFQYKWFQDYNWLCYSKKKNCAFSLPCSIFASTGGVNLKLLEKLVKSKFDNWKNVINHLSHENDTLRKTMFQRNKYLYLFTNMWFEYWFQNICLLKKIK